MRATLMTIALAMMTGCATGEPIDLGTRPTDGTIDRLAAKLENGIPLNRTDVAVLREIEANARYCLELAQESRQAGAACDSFHSDEFELAVEHGAAIRLALASSSEDPAVDESATWVTPGVAYAVTSGDPPATCRLVGEQIETDGTVTFGQLNEAADAWDSGECARPAIELSQWEVYESCRRYLRDGTTGAFWLDQDYSPPRMDDQVYPRDWALLWQGRFDNLFCG